MGMVEILEKLKLKYEDKLEKLLIIFEESDFEFVIEREF